MNIIMDIIMNIIMERDLNLRQQINPDKECLKYPYIYEYDLTPSLMFNEPVEEPIDFPKCVIHYYWIHEGIVLMMKFHGELFFSIEIILVKFVMVFILANVIIRGLIVMEQ